MQIHNFVVDNILNIKKEWYFHSYADKNILENARYKNLWELDDIFFPDILQGYICEFFYTIYGKVYKLPVEYCMNIHKYNLKKRKRLRNIFLCESYEKDRDHIIISTLQCDRFELINYKAGKYLPRPILLEYFAKFTTEIYYYAFYHIEISELEKIMRQYLNSRKVFVSSKDIKWFINKIRFIKEQQTRLDDLFAKNIAKENDNMLGWLKYWSGKPESEDFINYPQYTNKFLNLYEQNLDYLNSITSVQNNLVVIIVAVATLIATFIGIIITLIK